MTMRSISLLEQIELTFGRHSVICGNPYGVNTSWGPDANGIYHVKIQRSVPQYGTALCRAVGPTYEIHPHKGRFRVEREGETLLIGTRKSCIRFIAIQLEEQSCNAQ